MKKVIPILLFGLFAINTSNFLYCQVAGKDTIFAEVYYGGPNFEKVISSFLINELGIEAIDVTGIGPLGGKFEYMVADKLGLGFNVIYNTVEIDYLYDSLNNDGSLYKTYSGNLAMKRLRAQVLLNYHIELANPDIDFYLGIRAGSNQRFWSATSSNPEEFDSGKIKATKALFPVSVRVCTGFRYYFSEIIGLNMEFGFGGPLVSAGLSLKF